MKMKHIATIGLMLAILCSSCQKQESMQELTNRVFTLATEQAKLMDQQLDDNSLPRSYTPQGIFLKTGGSSWVSGFFPGYLWYIYQQSGDEEIRKLAEKNTKKLANVSACASGHDIGFQYWCSYGNAYKLTNDKSYLTTIEEASALLAKRFRPEVGCIRSWGNVNDSTNFLVIIDNMMNLELLMESSKLFSCDSLTTISTTHANTTMANHFREDNTSFHVLEYNFETGAVDKKRTAQGYSDESAWARGQSWGLYGYTMMFRETSDENYLTQAEKIAKALLPRLPEDGIPYWDYDCPAIPCTYRDVSAGAIMASALIELSELTKDAAFAKECIQMAEKQIRSMATKYMCSEPGQNGCFLLGHSVGNLHGTEKNSIAEVDAPLSYADYYFIEAILRFNARK